MTNTEKKVKPLNNSKPLTKPHGANARKNQALITHETRYAAETLQLAFKPDERLDTSLSFWAHFNRQTTIINRALKRLCYIAEYYGI